MDLTEINALVNLRAYLVGVINNSAFDRAVVNDLNSMLLLVDRKIVSLLRTTEFKEYINFSDAKKVVKEVADLNNIKSGLKK